VFAGQQPGFERRGEDGREVASCELGAEVGAVGCLLEEMGIGVEGDACAGMAEDAADLRDVEPDVDDEVACVGVSQVRTRASPSRWRRASVTARVKTRRATLRCRSGVPYRVAKT